IACDAGDDELLGVARGGTASDTEEFVVTGITGNVTVTVAPTSIHPDGTSPVEITITNNSGVTITGLKADLPKAPPLQWLPGLSGTGWDCQSASGLSCLPADRTLSPGE